ncbi:beta-1,3-galactosyltransferase 1-like [Liolophura sinensis]|uniref:beta-1,3-galactosyltransferase 1-like n=1 Tax=Liolophura sinensis TaxID=3198878 RepID=UPI0031592782
MKYWRYVRRVIVSILGSTLLLVIQGLYPGPSQPPWKVTHGRSFKPLNKHRQEFMTTSRLGQFSLPNLVRGNKFTLTYIRSVFCNAKTNPVPLNISSPKLNPNGDALAGKDVIVLVISSPVHSELREAIRRTWANSNEAGAAVIFVLGLHWDLYWNTVLTEEHGRHGDILQLFTPDTYRNLPEKILLGFHWVMDSVPRIKYVVKSDDDVYLHLPSVFAVVRNLSVDVIVGAYNPQSIVSRNIKDEWGVSKGVYLPDYFPPYVSGGSYLMSAHVTRRILSSVSRCRRLHIEDVFITGVLAVTSGLGHLPHSGFSFWGTPKAQPCDMKAGRVNSVNMGVKQIYKLHVGISIMDMKSQDISKVQ